MSTPHPTEPDVSVPVPLGLLRARGNPTLKVYAEVAIRARDGLIACSARDVAEWCEWSSYGTASKYLRRLVAAGALELLYPGSFRPGAVALDANVYRVTAVVDKPSRRAGGRADGAMTGAPSRRAGGRARSSPTGNQGAATTAGGGPHGYPCYCDECMQHLVALTTPEDP